MTVGKISDIPDCAVDLTKDGKCTGCGACCSNILPISKKEIKIIKGYIKRHNIKPCKHSYVLCKVPPEFDLTCPFLDTTKPDKKCMIYDVRPEICRAFTCRRAKQHETEHLSEMVGRKNQIVIVSQTFFGDRE